MGQTGRAIESFLASIVGLAILSVILSSRANATGVIGAASQGLAGVIGAATAPVTGSSAGGLSGGFSGIGSGLNLGAIGSGSIFGNSGQANPGGFSIPGPFGPISYGGS